MGLRAASRQGRIRKEEKGRRRRGEKEVTGKEGIKATFEEWLLASEGRKREAE